MKGLMIGLIGFSLLLVGWWDTYTPGSTEPVYPQAGQETMTESVSAIAELTGTWHAFPNGLVLRFNDDGSTQFGLDTDGVTLGYEAKITVENSILSIQFTTYNAQNDACLGQVGRYAVQSHDGGYLSFARIDDDCLFRTELLTGTSAADSSIMFHPLPDWQPER